MFRNHYLTFTLLMIFFLSCGGSDKAYLRKVPREQRKGLVVLNFKNNTPKSRAMEFKPWEFGLASMLMTDIESIGLFNIISKERLKDVVKEQEFQLSGMVKAKDMVSLGKMVGAKYILTGSFMEMKGNLRIEVQVFSVESGSQLGTSSVTGKTDDFFALEKELVTKISKTLDAMLTEGEKNKIAAKVETKSVKASLVNYKGEMEYQKAQDLKKAGKNDEAKKVLEKAKNDFKKAVSLDPAYEKAQKNLQKITAAIPVTL